MVKEQRRAETGDGGNVVEWFRLQVSVPEKTCVRIVTGCLES